MRVFALPAGFQRLAKLVDGKPLELSESALFKLQVLDLFRRCEDAQLTVAHYRISRATLYRWKRQFNPKDLASLENRSKRPHRVRSHQWTRELQEAVKELREDYGWGKEKLRVLLKRQGITTSASTVGRILTELKHSGRLREPIKHVYHRQMARPMRRYAVRKPHGLAVEHPGDLIELDTLHLRRHLSEDRFQFTARDSVSRWDVVEAYHRAGSKNAAHFLDTLTEECPFPIRALQVDGGSEFSADFETACKTLHIALYVLPPRSPKLNGKVERANRTHREEYYERTDVPQDLQQHNEQLKAWQDIYNTVRPHQALNYKCPLEVLEDYGIVASVPP